MPQADQLASHQCVPPAGENISGTAPVESAQGRAAFAASSSRWLTQVRQNRLIFILYNLLVTLLCVW